MKEIGMRLFRLINIAALTIIIILMTSGQTVDPVIQLGGFLTIVGTIAVWSNRILAAYQDSLFYAIRHVIVTQNGFYTIIAWVTIVYGITQAMALAYGTGGSGLSVFSRRFGGEGLAIGIIGLFVFMSAYLTITYSTRAAIFISGLFAIYGTIIVIEIISGNLPILAWTATGYLYGMSVAYFLIIVLATWIQDTDDIVINAGKAVTKLTEENKRLRGV